MHAPSAATTCCAAAVPFSCVSGSAALAACTVAGGQADYCMRGAHTVHPWVSCTAVPPKPPLCRPPASTRHVPSHCELRDLCEPSEFAVPSSREAEE